jgi:prevent-host-death family protein
MSGLAADDMLPSPNAIEDLVPISRLGAGSKVVRAVVTTGRPKVITEHGEAVAVIVEAATFEAMRRETAARDLLHDLQQAIAEVDAGAVVDHDEVMREVRSLFVGRVSAAALQELDEA